MQVTQRHGQRVGRIRRFGQLFHREQGTNHGLHLALIGMAMASDVGLHFTWRVAVNLQTILRGGQQDHAAHFRKPKSGAHVESSEDAFNSQSVTRVVLEKTENQLRNIQKSRYGTRCKGVAHGLERSKMEHVAAAAITFDNAIPSWA